MEYCSAIKKNEIFPFATTWVELEGIMLSEIRERQKFYDFTHMRNLRGKTDEHREGKQKSYKNREGDKTEAILKYGEQTEGYGRGFVGGEVG